jgi:hypothetical protein
MIPISLNEDWNLISRMILPVISQDDIAGPRATSSGWAIPCRAFSSRQGAHGRRIHLGRRPGLSHSDGNGREAVSVYGGLQFAMGLDDGDDRGYGGNIDLRIKW